MGQKTNPNILRLGQTKEWKSKYIEKKFNELPSYTFNDIEIQKFIYKFFDQNSLIVDNCKLSQSENFLHIFVSYFSLPKTKQLIAQINKHQKVKLKLKKRKSIKFLKKKANLQKNIFYYNLYNKKYFNEKIYKHLQLNRSNINIKHYYLNNKKFRRLNALNYYKTYHNIKTYKNIANVRSDLFVKKIIESLYLFMGKKLTIRLSLKQLNNDRNIIKTFSKKKKKSIKTDLLKLQKFQRNEFFKTGVSLLYSCMTNSKNAELLSKYIAFYLKVLKRHKFFLNFVKSTLKILLSKNFSCQKRVKISVKGRFNGAPRARQQILSVGIPPSLTLNSNINYSETTSFTPNGTFGVKVWTYS